MIVMDEFYHNTVFQLSSKKLIRVLEDIKTLRENEIEDIKDKITKYEQKRRAHEVWYQSLSPVRKFFAGRPPSHHQAVEYIVNVKERFTTIEQIKNKISEINKLIDTVQNEPEREQIVLENFLINDMKMLVENGGFEE